MNWPLFWALVGAFGLVIGNIMLIKHAAKLDKSHQAKTLNKPSSLAKSHHESDERSNAE